MRDIAVTGFALTVAVLGSLLLAGPDSRGCAGDSNQVETTPGLRRPVSLALPGDGRWLFVANRRSGSLSVIDTVGLRPAVEVSVGRKLADLAATPDGRHLLAVDEDADELILLSRQDAAASVIHRLQLSRAPVSVRTTSDGKHCFVASIWSRQVTIVDLLPSAPRAAKAIPMPFAPRQQLLVAGGKKLIVADSFGGRLGLVDVDRGELESVRAFPAHNIRGLALSRDGKELLAAHQVLNGLAQTTFDDIHWGNVMTNNLRVLALEAVVAPQADLLRGSRLHYLGDVGNAAGDPAQVAVTRHGQVVVALGGVGDVAIANEGEYRWQRVAVGSRPTAVVTSLDGRRAYVANQFADSISVVDLQGMKVTAEITLGPQPALGPAERGEILFYDARLAHDGWLSCHSCHTDGHSNGLLNDNLGDGSFGAPKRILSLLGVRDTAPYAWLGTMPDLESQIRKSILTTMHGREPTAQQVADLAAFLRTFPPPPARWVDKVDPAAIERGRRVFLDRLCARCHTPPEYTSKSAYDVGLQDEVGNTHFNPPSLRGVDQGGPFFHDNRAGTLEEVFTRFRHQLKNELSRRELQDLVTFLRSL